MNVRTRFVSWFWLAVLVVGVTVGPAHAQQYWDTNGATAGAGSSITGNWTASGTTWSTSSAGTSGNVNYTTQATDDLFFVAAPGAGSGNLGGTVTLTSAQVANSLNFNLSGGITLTGGTSITLGNGTAGAGGITVNQFAYGAVPQSTVTIATPVTLNNSQTWTNNSTSLVLFTNATTSILSGTANLTIAGPGRFSMTGTGTGTPGYSGNILISGGEIESRSNITSTTGPLGTGNIEINGGVLGLYFNNSLTRELGSGAGQVRVTGGVSGFTSNGGSGSTFNITGAIDWGTANFSPTQLVFQNATSNVNAQGTLNAAINLNGADRTIRSDNTGGLAGSGTFSGVISNGTGTAGLIKTGIGHHILSNTNTYNGATVINQGFLTATIMANGGVNSSIGNSSDAASNLVLGNGTTFRYNGAATSSNRSFTMNGTVAGDGATLDASGSGALNMTATATPAYGTANQTRTLTLSGTNTGNNTLAANVADNGTGAVSLTKSSTGAWFLTNNNTYTGTTTVSGGTLVLTAANSLPGGIGSSGGTSALVFSGGVLGLANGDFTRSLAAGSNATTFATGGGGWAAYNADRTVNLGGANATITWATATTGFNAQTLLLSTASATNTVTLTNPLDLGNAARTVQVADGTAALDAVLSGNLTGTGGGLTKTGTGILSLTGSNSYTGATTVNAGMLRLDSANALPGGIGSSGGTSALLFTGGVLGLGNGDFSRPLNTTATASAANFGAGGGGWAAYGANRTVNLGGANATITWATANTGFNNQQLTLSDATANATVTLTNAIDLGNAARTITVGNGTATIDAVLSGNLTGTGGGITKAGAGWLALSGTNTYTGTTTVNAVTDNTLVIQGSQALSPSTTVVLVQNSSPTGLLRILDDTGGSTATLSLPNTVLVDNANASLGASIFVGNNSVANGGGGGGGTTGSTISISRLGATGLASSKTAYGIIAEGANGYTLGINNVEVPTFLSGTYSAATTWNMQLTGNTAPISVTGNVTQLAVSTSPGNVTLTLALSGTNANNSISGLVTNSLDATPRPLTVSKSGTGTWTLSGNNTYNGTATISGGTLRLGAAGDATNTPLGTTALGTLVNTTGTLDLNGFTLGTAEALSLGGSGTSNSGALANTSSTGVNYSGLVTLTAAARIVSTGNISLTNTGTITGATFGLTLDGAATGSSLASIIGTTSGTVTKTGTGTWTLSGNSTYTGATTISQGTLRLGATGDATNTPLGTTGTGTTVSTTATLDLNGFTLGTAEALNISGSGTSNGGALANTSSTGVNYSGLVTLGAASRIVSTGNISLTNVGTITGAGFALTLDGSATGSSITSIIGNTSGGVTKEGSGVWALSGTSTYTGATTVNGGTLRAGAAAGGQAFGSLSAVTVANTAGAALDLNNFNQTIGSLAGGGTTGGNVTLGSGTLTIAATSGTATYAGVISGSGGLTRSSTGNQTLSGNNTYTGLTTVTGGGTLTLSGDNALMTGGVTLSGATANTRLNIGSATALGNGTFTISGGTSGAFDNTSGGALTLTTNNAQVWNSDFLFTGTNPLNMGTGNVTMGGTRSVTNGGTLTVGGVISGGAGFGLTKGGAGTLVLSGNASTYTGATAINQGTLSVVSIGNVGAASSLGAPTATANGTIALGLTTLGGTLRYIGTGDTTNRVINLASTTSNVTIDQSGTGLLRFTSNLTATGAGAKTLILSGSTSGTGEIAGNIVNSTLATTISKTGTGLWTLAGNNTYTGNTTISGGTLQFARNASLYNNAPASWNATNIVVQSGATIGFNVGGTNEFTTGNITTLLTNLATSNSTTNGMNAGSRFAFDTTNASGGNFTISNIIANSTGGSGGARGVTKLGTNTLILTGNNSYTGSTDVNAGTLRVNGSLASGSVVTVLAGATLGGNGTVGGPTTIFGIHDPGNSPGVQTFSSDLTYSGGNASVNWELIGNTITNTGNNTFDQIVITNNNLNFAAPTGLNLTFNGSGSTVSWNATFWSSNQSWTLHDVVAGTTSGIGNFTVNVLDWQDSGGVALSASSRAGSSFNVSLSGQDVLINYIAVPEPGTIALLVAGVALLGFRLARRRRT